MNDSTEINILGTIYTIIHKSISEDNKLQEMEGYTDVYGKNIIIGKIEERDWCKTEPIERVNIIKNKILRHEIIHAFLFESGLDVNSDRSYSWATNEEMVDWFALQGPKIYDAYKQLNII